MSPLEIAANLLAGAPGQSGGNHRVTKPFRRGQVVGVFCPLHRGHETVIDTALSQCDEVLAIRYIQPAFEHRDADARER